MKKITAVCSVVQANFLTRFLLTLCALLTFSISYAQTPRTSNGSGPWNVATTWTPNGVPGNADDITIAAGHTVTVPANATCRRLYISGTLNMTGTNITMDITNNSVSSATNGLQLNSGGSINIGSTNTVYFSSTQASGIVNNGGTIVSTGTNGQDGGTIRTNACCGGEFRVSGTAATTVYNLDFLQNANFNIQSSLRVNGTLSMDDNNWSSSSSALSPIWGPASTLSINWNGQGISSTGSSPLNGALEKMWSATTGTIGVTPGYPNNVTIANVGTSNGSVNVPPNINVGWAPNVNVGLNGSLNIGNGTQTGFVSLHNVPSFNSGGIVVDNGSTLVSPNFGNSYINRGNFTLQGATTGLYYPYGATMNFAGSGTVGSPQIISTTAPAGSIIFSSITVSNGTYVRLDDDLTVTNTLTLTSGYVGTSSTNTLTVSNSASGAIVGGSSTAYIDGPLIRTLPASPAAGYLFPVGDLSGGAYLPMTITSGNSTGGTNVTVEGFNTNSGGSPDATISAISPTEYWRIGTTNPFTVGPSISVSRPTAVSPYNSLGKSSTANGVYTAIGGSPSGSTISGGGPGSTNPVFITMVNAFLNVVRVGGAIAGVNSSCAPTPGSLIVGGVGGTPPYQFSVDGGAFSSATTYSPLAVGDHTVTVRDALNNTETNILKVLGAVQINGNDEDVIICPPASTTLVASNLLNSSATYSWTPGGATTSSITVSPVVTTTYTVTSTVYANNLLTNGSFEGGSLPSGFNNTGAYQAHAGGYGTTPGSGGFYKLGTAGTTLCTFFTSLAAQDGTWYYVADGSTGAMDIFSLNLTGLTTGVAYRFSFWYAKGSPTAPNSPIDVRLNGASIGSVTTSDHTAWTQATYTFNAPATTATITLRNTLAPGNTDGNDFYLDNFQLLSPCTVTASVDVIPDCSLPVELLDFNAVKQGTGALLTWSTTSEFNSSHFVIERSSDGISFSPIGTVNAAGNSSTLLNYTFTDPSIPAGVTYYRLVQYDLDGTAHYSIIRAVNKDGISGVQIVPNPNNGVFSVLFNNTGDVKAQIIVVNALGQTVYEGSETNVTVQNIDISALASGIYYLKVNTAEETTTVKVLKD